VLGLLGLLFVICFIWSHQIFTKGESLKTSKRFLLLLDDKVVDVLTIVGALIISYVWLVD
jgi:hypothetical protein